MANNVSLILSGQAKTIKTTDNGGVHTTHHIVDVDQTAVTLLTAQAATGAAVLWPGGSAQWSIWGTWDGAEAQLQYSPDGGSNWADLDIPTEVLNGGSVLGPVASNYFRVVITGAGGSTSLSSNLKRA